MGTKLRWGSALPRRANPVAPPHFNYCAGAILRGDQGATVPQTEVGPYCPSTEIFRAYNWTSAVEI